MASAQWRSSSDDGDRPVLREPLQPVPHDLEGPVLERLRRELAQASLRVRLEGEPEHRGEVRGDLGGRSPKSRSMLRPSATRTRISGSSASTPSQERTRSRNGQYVMDSP